MNLTLLTLVLCWVGMVGSGVLLRIGWVLGGALMARLGLHDNRVQLTINNPPGTVSVFKQGDAK